MELMNFYAKKVVGSKRSRPKRMVLSSNGTTLIAEHQFVEHCLAAARYHDVMVANGVGEEIGGIGRVVESDALLSAAQVGQLQVFKQFALGSKVPVRQVIETAKQTLYTGHIGDGKIFVTDVENVVRVRTGEEGYDALQTD